MQFKLCLLSATYFRMTAWLAPPSLPNLITLKSMLIWVGWMGHCTQERRWGGTHCFVHTPPPLLSRNETKAERER